MPGDLALKSTKGTNLVIHLMREGNHIYEGRHIGYKQKVLRVGCLEI